MTRIGLPSSVRDSRAKFALFVNIAPAVEQRLARATNVLERELSIVDAVAVHLLAHVMNRYSRAWSAGLVANADEEGVDAFVGTVEDQLGEDHGVVGVYGRLRIIIREVHDRHRSAHVRNPILL